jgi:endogenous inhibitor of DNA gyrase (YacG/DUF329 family)
MSDAPCPICKKPSRVEYRPFCSKRCADVDLQRWFTGRYAIPGRPDDEAPEGARGPAAEDDET